MAPTPNTVSSVAEARAGYRASANHCRLQNAIRLTYFSFDYPGEVDGFLSEGCVGLDRGEESWEPALPSVCSGEAAHSESFHRG